MADRAYAFSCFWETSPLAAASPLFIKLQVACTVVTASGMHKKAAHVPTIAVDAVC